MKLSDKVQRIITDWPLGFVATVSVGGRPNVSPKGTFLVLDDTTLAFGEIRSPQTLTNITNTPECEVNFLDMFTRKGVRVRGNTELVRRGTDAFDMLIPNWADAWGTLADRINVIVKINVQVVQPLSSPPYDDGMDEADMIALYKKKFAAMYP